MRQLIYFFFLVGIFFSLSNPIQAQLADGCYTFKNMEDNKYLSHGGSWSSSYVVNRGEAQGWEKFWITNVGDGKFTIYGEDGKYISAHPNGLVWKAGEPQAWEHWTFDSNRKLFISNHDYLMYPNNVDILQNVDPPRSLIHLYHQWLVEPSSGCKVP